MSIPIRGGTSLGASVTSSAGAMRLAVKALLNVTAEAGAVPVPYSGARRPGCDPSGAASGQGARRRSFAQSLRTSSASIRMTSP